MRRLVAFLIAVAATTASASAQIVPCSAVSDQGSKILLDDIVTSAGTENFLQSLTSRLDANLTQVQTELGVDLKVLPCLKRRPTGPSDFTRSLVQELNVRGVLMEVWGTTTQVKDQQGRPFNEASIGYVIIPVRLDELQSQKAPGAFVISHRSTPSTIVDDLLRLVDQAGRLGAYASLAVGSKSLRAQKWGEARKQLCAADTQFGKLKSPSADDALLAAHAKQLAGDAVTTRTRRRPVFRLPEAGRGGTVMLLKRALLDDRRVRPAGACDGGCQQRPLLGAVRVFQCGGQRSSPSLQPAAGARFGIGRWRQTRRAGSTRDHPVDREIREHRGGAADQRRERVVHT